MKTSDALGYVYIDNSGNDFLFMKVNLLSLGLTTEARQPEVKDWIRKHQYIWDWNISTE